jgi:pseudoazurin
MFQFDPSLLRTPPGDTVHFVAKDKGHDVLSIPGMLADGVQSFKGEITKPGVYGIECSPHYGTGMVALIVVGDPSSNLVKAEAVPQPGKAKKALPKMFEQVTEHPQAAAASSKC